MNGFENGKPLRRGDLVFVAWPHDASCGWAIVLEVADARVRVARAEHGAKENFGMWIELSAVVRREIDTSDHGCGYGK